MRNQLNWSFEVGGNFQVPIITAPLATLIKSIIEQLNEMSKTELQWLIVASENIAEVCKQEIENAESSK